MSTVAINAAERAAGNFAVVAAWWQRGEQMGAIAALVEIHRERQWEALGYASWDAACDRLFGGARLALPASDRAGLHGELRAEGMSTRAIAAVTGVSNATVHRDLATVSSETVDSVRSLDGRIRPAHRPAPEPDVLTEEQWRADVYEPEVAEDLAEAEVPEPIAQRVALVYAGGTVVASLRDGGDALWRWARANSVAVRVDRTSLFGNPFLVGEDGTRDEVIANYAWYLDRKPSLLERLPSLRGTVLGCWCHPEPCHADILAERAMSL